MAKGRDQAEVEDVDEAVVEEVGQKEAVPLLPQEEGEDSKELVIHVPEETAKSAEIGVLSTLVILILIASAIAVAYFVYDRKRQKKIKECVEKLQQTEEGSKRRGSRHGTPNEPPPPDPFSISDGSSIATPLQGAPDDDMTTTTTTTTTATTSEGLPDSEVAIEVTTETEPNPDDANNNRNRNANAVQTSRSRRCCLCFCCPPAPAEPSLEEIWRQKKSQLKYSRGDKTSRHSLQVMGEGMKHLEGHHSSSRKQPAKVSGSSQSRKPNRLKPNRHRRHRGHRTRSQSQPASCKKQLPLQPSHNDNRSCWTQAALLKRSQSLSPGPSRRRHGDSRRHRLGVGGPRRRRADVDRNASRHVLDDPRLTHHPHRSRSPGRLQVDRSLGDHRRSRSLSKGGENQHSRSRSRNGQCPHDERYQCYVKTYRDGSQKVSHIHRDRSQSHERASRHDDDVRTHSHSRGGQARDANHHAKCPRHSSRDQSCGQIHHAKNLRDRGGDHDEGDGRQPCDRHQHSSHRHLEDCHRNQSHHRQNMADPRAVRTHQIPYQRFADRGQLGNLCDSEQGLDHLQGHHVPSPQLSTKKRTYHLTSPSHSHGSQGDATGSTTLYSENAEHHNRDGFLHNRPQHRIHRSNTTDYDNQNQSAYWSTSLTRTAPRFPHTAYPNQPHRKGYCLTRTIPYTDNREESVTCDYDRYPAHYPYQYGHLNVSQNYNCEDSDLTPSHVDGSTSRSPGCGTQAENEESRDQNDELSDSEDPVQKRKVCRKRSSRPRLRRALARLKAFPTSVYAKGNKGSDQRSCKEQDSSTSSEHSPEREDTVSLAQRLFGLKLSSTKRSKRQKHGLIKRKRRHCRAEESQPLLAGHTSWDSEDTTYEASKGTEPVDSGYDISASFLSEAHPSDLTLTQLSPFPPRRRAKDETAIIRPVNRGHLSDQQKPETDGTTTGHSPVGFVRVMQQFQNSVSESKSNNNSVPLGQTEWGSPDRAQHAERDVAFQRLGTKSNTDQNLACLGEFSKDDQREFRQLATQRWCEQQCSAGNPLNLALNNVLLRENKDDRCTQPSSTQSLEIDSFFLLEGQGKSEYIHERNQTKEHSSCVQEPGKILSKFAHAAGAKTLCSPHTSTVQEVEECSVAMDPMDFTSSVISNRTVACSESTYGRDVDSLLAEELESVDMFDELARDRVKCHEQNRGFLSCKSCVAGSDPNNVRFVKSRGAQNIIAQTNQKNGSLDHVQNAYKAAAYIHFRVGDDNHASTNRYLRKFPLQHVSRTSSPADWSADRGHLSASILPPPGLKG